MPKVKPIPRQKRPQTRAAGPAGAFFVSDAAYDMFCVSGYTTLDHCPEVMTAARKIAETIAIMTIYIMENTPQGDKRIENELSRKIDINPCAYLTRKAWIESIVMNLLIYGHGNSVVRVNTERGRLGDMEPVPPQNVSYEERQDGHGYYIYINGVRFNPDEVLHFILNPDPFQSWRGRGVDVSLKDITDNLRQAAHTEKKFMESPKPSLIIKVDAFTEEFSTPDGRRKIANNYIRSTDNGEPWIIPAEQFQIDQIKPLTLADLAINDNVKINKEAVAAIFGVPAFLLGVGEYKKDAWNAFINTTIKTICAGIQQELTKKLILNPKWYIKFNFRKLFDWDLNTISAVYGSLSDRGFITGNEIRDLLDMSPREGLDELRVLENYIPYEMSGKQNKLIQE